MRTFVDGSAGLSVRGNDRLARAVKNVWEQIPPDQRAALAEKWGWDMTIRLGDKPAKARNIITVDGQTPDARQPGGLERAVVDALADFYTPSEEPGGMELAAACVTEWGRRATGLVWTHRLGELEVGHNLADSEWEE